MHTPIALTCGEPSGVGPEIAEQAWLSLRGEISFFYIGDPRHLPGRVPFELVDSPADARRLTNALPVLRHEFPDAAIPGTPSPANAQSVIDVIARAVGLVTDGQAAAVCTAPIHKKALIDGAGFAFPGHTEFLAHLANVDRVVMMLASHFCVWFPPPFTLRFQKYRRCLPLSFWRTPCASRGLRLLGISGYLIHGSLWQGWNPHAGEAGAMGTEDTEIIAPVLAKLRTEGMRVSGPHSADTMFHAAAREKYDAAVAMYHDQALIPIKTLDFDGGVNVTLGLPFVRTSPDHGTALDIAGRGIANSESTIAALRLARDMAAARAS